MSGTSAASCPVKLLFFVESSVRRLPGAASASTCPRWMPSSASPIAPPNMKIYSLRMGEFEHKKVVVRAAGGNEVAHDAAVAGEFLADKACRVPLLAQLPVVLAIEDVLFDKRDFEGKLQVRNKRDFERQRKHRPEVRHADQYVRTRHARELAHCFVKLLKRQVLEHLERAGDVVGFIRKRERKYAAHHVGAQVGGNIHRGIRDAGIVFNKIAEDTVAHAHLEHRARTERQRLAELVIITDEPALKPVTAEVVMRFIHLYAGGVNASALRIAGMRFFREWCSRTYCGESGRRPSAGSALSTGSPQAAASSTTLSRLPVSLRCINRVARRYSSRNCTCVSGPKNSTRAPSFCANASRFLRSGPSPAMCKARPCSTAVRIARSWRLDGISRPTESRCVPRTTPRSGQKKSVSMPSSSTKP